MKMLDVTPFTVEQLQRMAWQRARGETWETIAEGLNVSVASLEQIAWTHEKQWNRMLTKAERIVAREALTEAVVALRSDLRTVEAKLRPTIVNSLARVLKLQQEYAPPRRSQLRVVGVPSPDPLELPQPVSQSPSCFTALPKLGPVLPLLVAFFLRCVMFFGSWATAATPTTTIARRENPTKNFGNPANITLVSVPHHDERSKLVSTSCLAWSPSQTTADHDHT